MATKSTKSGSDNSSVVERLKNKYRQSKDTAKNPTGVLPLDYALTGGYAPSSFIEVAADNGVGKSTMCLHMSKNLIKTGHRVLYLNTELATVQYLIEAMGMDTLPDDKFLLLTPSKYSEVEEILRDICYSTKIYETPVYDHIIVDSVGAILADMMADRNSDETVVGARARQQGTFFEIHTPEIKRRGITMWFINHLTTVIETGFMGKTYTDSKGSKTLKYYMDVRLLLESGTKLHKSNKDMFGKVEKDYYGNIGKIQAFKNKSGKPFRQCLFPIFYGKGISNTYWLYEVLKQNGFVTTSGSSISIKILDPNEPSKLGTAKALKYVQENQKAIISKLQELDIWDIEGKKLKEN